ncbi:MAG TPA: hypothetical protein VN683_01555, partial [Acidothermaceae bacterium]|nr:hypothetical protein [Acidothermaceae bacterium]
MTTSWTTRAGGITLVALIAAAGCSSKTHATSASSSAPASTAVASSAPAVSSSAAPATSAVASASGPTSAPSSVPAPTTAPAAPPSGPPADALAGFEPASVTFVSSTQGFVLGGSKTCSTSTCGLLASTSDGGVNWSLVALFPAPISGPNPAVSKVRFATKNDGWAFGPQLWSTHDGGRTWTAQATPGPVYDVEASGGVAYLLEATCGTEPCVQGDRLLQTPVSSDGWTAISGPKLA